MAAKTNTKKTTAIEVADDAEVKTPSDGAKDKPFVAKEIDIHRYVTVRNGFQGRLVYKSQKTGERFVWDEFGSEQEMELLELRNAKNTAKKFFENNWFMFDEDWIVDYLGLKQFYKHAIKIEDFDKIFELSPSEIKKTVCAMTAGQKRSVEYRANKLIAEDAIDSNKVINALEEALECALIER